MSVLLNKHNFAVAQFAATEESRYTLRAIHVTEHETVATNGHYLVRVSNPKVDANNFPVMPGFRNGGKFQSFNLSVNAAKEIEKAIPNSKKNKIPILQNALVAHYAETESEPEIVKPNIGVTDLDSPKVFNPRPVEGQFPNWEMVVPKKPATLTICVDANYLAKLAASAAKFADNGRTAFVRLQFTDADSCVRLDAHNQDTDQGWTGLLMPVRKAATDCHGANNIPDVKTPEAE